MKSSKQSVKASLKQIPDSAKKGPVSVANFDLRAGWHGAGIACWNEGDEANWPFLSHAPEAYAATADEAAWDRYFLDHLNGYPESYKFFKRGVIRFYNVPEARPELFDSSYQP